MVRTTRTAMLVALALALAIAAGCSGKSTATSDSSAPATPPTITIDAPAAKAEVPAGEVQVKVTTTDLKFTMPSNKNVPGEGHVHFTLDDQPFKMSTEPAYTFKDVAPGPHKLEAEVVQNDTKSFEPPIVAEVEFTAK